MHLIGYKPHNKNHYGTIEPFKTRFLVRLYPAPKVMLSPAIMGPKPTMSKNAILESRKVPFPNGIVPFAMLQE